MATINLDGNFLYVTNGVVDTGAGTVTTSGAQVAVKISNGENGISHNFNKEGLIELRVPTTDPPASGGSGTPSTRVKDLLRIKEVIGVNGWLPDESGDTAISKKNKLITLINWGGSLSIVWGVSTDVQSATGFITKIDIKESVGEVVAGSDMGGGDAPSHRNFNVQLSFTVGADL